MKKKNLTVGIHRQFSQDTDQITHANSMQNEFESKVISFERQKIGDLREILLDFTLIQMQENVKALEILTEAHGHIADISIDDDLEVSMAHPFKYTRSQDNNRFALFHRISVRFSLIKTRIR